MQPLLWGVNGSSFVTSILSSDAFPVAKIFKIVIEKNIISHTRNKKKEIVKEKKTLVNNSKWDSV